MNSIEVVRNGGRIVEMEDILRYFGECFDTILGVDPGRLLSLP